jgi:hypothetical protein
MAAARLANMPVGHPSATNSANLPNISQADAAVMLNVGVRSVTDATKVQERGSQGLIKAVDSGAITVSVAAPLSEMDDEEIQAERAWQTSRAWSPMRVTARPTWSGGWWTSVGSSRT